MLKMTVITDTHYYSQKIGIEGKAYEAEKMKSQRLLAECGELLWAAFRQIADDKSNDIVLLSGDVTNNGEICSHLEFIEMLRWLKNQGKRVYVITATHDYKSDGTTRGFCGDELISIPAARREELFELYREFGPDDALAIHRESMSYTVDLSEEYRLLALNDDSNLNGSNGFSKECFQWISEQIKQARRDRKFIIAMTHHPLIPPTPVYEIIGLHHDMQTDYKNTLESLADMGVQFILTGHTHIHNISSHLSKSGNMIYDICTSSLVGYPAVFRNLTFDTTNSIVNIETSFIDNTPNFDLKGNSLQEYLANQLVGMVRDLIHAAGSSIDTLAYMITSVSISSKFVYKYGWLIKPFAKWFNNLNMGRLGRWTKAETGLKPQEYAKIGGRPVVDFIVELIMNLYGGESKYPPETPEYKIIVGTLNIIDSILRTLHIDIKKITRVSGSIREMLEPLLYNPDYSAYNVTLPIMPFYENGHTGFQPKKNKSISTVKESRKGLPIVIIASVLLLILLPFIIILLTGGFIVNNVRYRDKLRK